MTWIYSCRLRSNSNRIYNALVSLNLSDFAVDSFAKTAVQARIKERYYAEFYTINRWADVRGDRAVIGTR